MVPYREIEFDDNSVVRRESVGVGLWLYVLPGCDSPRVNENSFQSRLCRLCSFYQAYISELSKAMLLDYENNNRKSYEITEQRWNKRLLPFFGDMRAVNVSTDNLNTYIAECKQTGLENATINRDLAALKRAFYLAYRSTPRKVNQVPTFPRLRENAPRRGFVEQAQYKLLRELCKGELWLCGILTLGYNFGFREGELLSMRVRQVDLLNEALMLDPGTTKNDEGRNIAFNDMPEVMQVLRECLRGKSADDFLFTREGGKAVTDFRGAWWSRCIKAGLGKRVCADCGEIATQTKRCKHCKGKRLHFDGLLFHDLRRSAVRNMVRRGVPERVAMQISGHKTRSVFDRYNIVNQSDLREAARKIAHGAFIANEDAEVFENGSRLVKVGAVVESDKLPEKINRPI